MANPKEVAEKTQSGDPEAHYEGGPVLPYGVGPFMFGGVAVISVDDITAKKGKPGKAAEKLPTS